VNAEAKGQMAVGAATNIEMLRIGELRGITVGRANTKMHIRSRRHLHIPDVRVLGCPAVAKLI
jgi:hypothetical protein